MVEEIKKLIQKVKSEKGDIILFMLWKDIADFDKWSVIISANWIDKIEQRKALNYWLILLQKSLSNKDLDSIGRISFLKSHDRFVKLFTSALNVSGGPMYFKNSEVGNYYIHDAIIFEAKKTILPKKQNIYQKNPTLNGSINPNINGSINPNINGSINPNINGSINPNINGSINPNINGSINPNINGSINPNINGSINPNINGSINPNINGSINPNINGSINPNINGSINPNINYNFAGLFLYDLNIRKVTYLIKINDKTLIMFDMNNNFTNFCIKAKKAFYNVFDLNNKWIGFIVSDSKDGFNYFDLNNKWIGFIK